MTMLQVGDAAPEVELPDESGATHRLSDRRGEWTVLYFYPTDDTPGCSTEACEFRDAHDDIRGRQADVWGVSPQGAGSKRAFREKFALPFTLLADPDHAAAEDYGVWGERNWAGKTYMGIERSTFVIDADGKVAKVMRSVKPDTHADEVLAALP